MPSPFYDRDGVTIHLGDNCEILATLPPDSVDLVVTSPPYDDLRTYGGHSWDFYGVAWLLKRVIKPGGVIVWIVNDQTIDGSETGSSFRQALHFKDLGLNLHDTMIYRKSAVGACGSHYSYWQEFEYVFIFTSGKPLTVNRIKDKKNTTAGSSRRGGIKKARGDPTTPFVISEQGIRGNVWTYHTGMMNNDDTTAHPAPFPQRLAVDHITSWSNEGDVVLDPFNGSGTTTKMARETGRRAIGIEINAEYCDIAKQRLAQQLIDFETAAAEN